MPDKVVNDPAAPPAAPAIALVIEGRPRPVGTFTVARLIPAPQRRHIGPFVFIDHLGPAVIPPGVGFDVPPHPHIGLSTVTYLLVGENVHRDSLGTVQWNRPGDLNLMTAGRGVVHSERAEPQWRATGGTLNGVQLWLGLPTENEQDAPTFEHHPSATLPVVRPAAGVTAQILFGAAFGQVSPVRHPSQPLLVDLKVAAAASLLVPCLALERAILVLQGAVTLDGQPLLPNQLALLAADAVPTLTAQLDSRVLLLGGTPLVGPRFIDWNFVASSRETIDRARRAWQARTFPSIPGDDSEFVPLPAAPPPSERPGKI